MMIPENEAKYDEKKAPFSAPVAQQSPARMRAIRPKIDPKKCEKNYSCLVFCPHNAISLDKNNIPVIDYNVCTGCLICLRECPCFAITEEQEKKNVKM
jgi:2-oxoacid:acceptor oxidoreductase delta subunit (pyruvate/2-ketoisovalerate family)